MAQAKYLDAAQDLRRLQGTGEFSSLENPKMGSKDFAILIGENYNLGTLKRARQILDTEQDMQTLNEEDPISTTLEYGCMTREWLERQAVVAKTVKHPMVTKKEDLAVAAEKAEKESEEEGILSQDIAGFLGKDLPEDSNTQLLMWAELNVLQKKLKTVEMAMRKKMAIHFFPKPTEGTNTEEIGKGWKVKLKHTISRTADEASFEAVFAELKTLDDAPWAKEDFFKFKPELIKSKYNKLTDTQRVIFDQCLIIKPGSPALEVVAPKEEK